MPMRSPKTSPHSSRAVRLVGQAEHRGRMGVVDELRRHEGVQQQLDRRRRRRRIDQVGALHAHDVLVRERIARAQLHAAARAAPRAGRPARSSPCPQPEPLTHSTSTVVAVEIGACASSPRCCRRRAARACGPRRAGASCRRAAQDRARHPRNGRPRPRRRDRPTRSSSILSAPSTTSRSGAAWPPLRIAGAAAGSGCNDRLRRRCGRLRSRRRLHVAHRAGGEHRRGLAHRRAALRRLGRGRRLGRHDVFGRCRMRAGGSGAASRATGSNGCGSCGAGAGRRFGCARPVEIGDRVRDLGLDAVLRRHGSA